MSNNFSNIPFPNPMMFMPFVKASDRRKYEIRTRTYQAIAKFWTAVNWKLSLGSKKNDDEKGKSGDAKRVRDGLKTFNKDIKKIYKDFKEGERYDELNMLEQWGDEMGKFMHRSTFWGGMYDRERVYEIYNAVEVFWDDFFTLEASEDKRELHDMLRQFNEDVWDAYDLDGLSPQPEESE